MALVVLLRGVNVGGHHRFRPKMLADELNAFDVVNIGAAGTFVVRKPGTEAHFRRVLGARLPAGTHVVVCHSRTLLRAEVTMVRRTPRGADVVPFVSFLASVRHAPVPLPLSIPAQRPWFVRVTAVSGRVAVGEYRRHMKTIGYLGQLDEVFGTVVTTRSQKTVDAILQTLKNDLRPRRSRGVSAVSIQLEQPNDR